MGNIIDDFIEAFTGELKFPDLFGEKKDVPKKMTREQIAQDKAALKSFIESPVRVSHLTDEFARTSLERGVVGIVYGGNEHLMSGLLITKNGYVVTNYDVVEHLKDTPLSIRTEEGNTHKVLRVSASSQQNNIAILKVDMDGPAKSMKYKFTDRRSPHVTFAVTYLTRPNKSLSKQVGMIHSARPESFKIKDKSGQLTNQVLIERIKRSDVSAGAVVATADGEIFGIASGTITDSSKTTCTSWAAVLVLLKKLANGEQSNAAKK